MKIGIPTSNKKKKSIKRGHTGGTENDENKPLGFVQRTENDHRAIRANPETIQVI